MGVAKFSESTRTIYYALGITVLIGGALIWGWKQVFPAVDFRIRYEQGNNVLPETAEKKLAGLGYSIGSYMTLSITNVTHGRLEDVGIQFNTSGYADIKAADGTQSSKEFEERLAIGDIPADGTVSVKAWTSYFPSYGEN